jgi:bifunctional non-homologous end joining protein LigD
MHIQDLDVCLKGVIVSEEKEYHVHLIQQGKGYVVRIEYGRRGSSLTSGTKTPIPLDLDKATAIFDKQVHDKQLKGYTEGAGQSPYVGSTKEDKITGVLPQLLNLIEEEDLDDYFDDPDFCMQEKKDGRRILLRKVSGVTEAINRKGLLVGFPTIIADTLGEVVDDFVIDGELIGETIWLFDILEFAGTDLRTQGYVARHKVLLEEFIQLDEDGSAVQLVATVFTAPKKRKVFQSLRAKGSEGVVFKRVDALYKVGRPASGGDQLKFKFTQTCTCRVSGINEKGKRSVYIQVLDGEQSIEVGKVTVLPNFSVPEVGTLVEVKYLYRHVHGALYQPIYIGVRDDIDQPDQVSTLKVKEGIDIDEEES